MDRTAEITWTELLTFLKTIRAAGREDCCSWSTDLITNINIIIIRVTIDMHPSPPEKIHLLAGAATRDIFYNLHEHASRTRASLT